jgi:hypothetical protein
MLETMNLLGAVTALAYTLSCSLLFVLRLVGRTGVGRAVGFAQMLFALPLAVLLAEAPGLGRTPLYYLQTGLLVAFILFEAIVDTILRVDFRGARWAVIGYVVFFFAATGGMLGVASLAGPVWMVAGAAAFLSMAGLAFAQRRYTGL